MGVQWGDFPKLHLLDLTVDLFAVESWRPRDKIAKDIVTASPSDNVSLGLRVTLAYVRDLATLSCELSELLRERPEKWQSVS